MAESSQWLSPLQYKCSSMFLYCSDEISFVHSCYYAVNSLEVPFRKSLPIPIFNYFPLPSSAYIHSELIFIQRQRCLFFYMKIYQIFWHSLSTRLSFSNAGSGHLCKKSDGCSGVGLLLGFLCYCMVYIVEKLSLNGLECVQYIYLLTVGLD